MSLALGRRPPVPAPALRLASLLAPTLPDLPRRTDQIRRLHGGWDMLGNDVAGDCEAVRWANSRRLTTALLDTEHYPSQDDVWTVYRTQNPYFALNGSPDTNGPGSGADQGMNTQRLLDYLHRNGGPDGVKPVAYAKVDPVNEHEMDAAVTIFGEVWLDIVVQQAQRQQFAAGQPWNYTAGSPVEGGHAVLGGAFSYGANNSLGFVTWGQEAHLTDLYRQSMVQEAWVVMWPEQTGTKEFRAGIDGAKLADYFHAITGRAIALP